ncbi:MAG: phosphatidate cytidylyltransferase [Firmicutes bacterium]|nr:phosphatidate cytidylyltransferase [Bacillota bacterium]
MNAFEKLSAVHRGGVLVLAILTAATIVIWLLKKVKPQSNLEELVNRIKSWWVMAAVFFGAISLSKNISLLFFGLLSFWALKEYVTILKTRRADHWALLLAFLAVPVQFYWIHIGWYGMFLIFIPVYMFLFLPILLMLAQEPSGYLESSAKIQWGLIAFVYGLSHLGYLLKLPELSGRVVSGQALLLFLVIITEMNDVFQYLWGKTIGTHKILPKISPKKTWEGFVGGVLTTTVFSLLVKFLTPFNTRQVMLVAFILAVAGFCGDVVMSAIKRDVGIKDFSAVIPGHGGMLDRVDSLCYTAPIFFHMVAYFYFQGIIPLF